MRQKSANEHPELQSLRSEIDECDKQIIALLARRYALVQAIGRYKAARNLPIQDEGREKALLEARRRQAAAYGNYRVDEIFRVILEQSRQFQDELQNSSGSQG